MSYGNKERPPLTPEQERLARDLKEIYGGPMTAPRDWERELAEARRHAELLARELRVTNSDKNAALSRVAELTAESRTLQGALREMASRNAELEQKALEDEAYITALQGHLEEARASARAEGYQAGVRDAEGMAEVHRNLCQQTLDAVEHWRTGSYSPQEVETACVKVAADILHDIRTLKEPK